MRVNFRGFTRAVTRQGLNIAQSYTLFQQMCSKTMPQSMRSHFFPDSHSVEYGFMTKKENGKEKYVLLQWLPFMAGK